MATFHAKYTTGSLGKHLYSLALPAFWVTLSNLSLILMDIYFLSKLNKESLVAIGIIFPLVAAFNMIGVGLGTAVSSLLSRRIGAAEYQAVHSYIIALFLLIIGLSLFVAIFGNLSIDALFSALGAKPDILPFIRDFMRVWYIGFFVMLVNYAGYASLRAAAYPKAPAYTQICSAILNAILSPFFIFIMHWGIMGAALAGMISRFLTGSVLLYLMYKKNLLSVTKKSLFNMTQHWLAWKEILSLSIPAGLTNAIGPLSGVWVNYLLSSYSINMLAAYAVVSRVETIALIPLYALSASVGPIIGQNFGAQFLDRVYLTLKKSYFFSIAWGLAATILLLFLGHLAIMIFSSDPRVVRIAMHYLYTVPISYGAWGVIMMASAYFNSIGSPRVGTFMNLIRLLIVFIPLSYLGSAYLGYLGIFIAFSASNVIISLLALYLSFFKKRRHKVLEKSVFTSAS